MRNDNVHCAALVRCDTQVFAKIDVVFAYENLSAALWATDILDGLLRSCPEGPRRHLSPWSFATLGDRHWCSLATAAAAHAHLIVIAASSEAKPLPPPVATWLERCLASPRTAQLAVAALLGHEHRADRADSPRLRWMQHLARKTGCKFFSPFIVKNVLASAQDANTG